MKNSFCQNWLSCAHGLLADVSPMLLLQQGYQNAEQTLIDGSNAVARVFKTPSKSETGPPILREQLCRAWFASGFRRRGHRLQ